MERTIGPDRYFDERLAPTSDPETAAISTPEVVGPVVDFDVGLAGRGRALELRNGEPFTTDSRRRVSVWGKRR